MQHSLENLEHTIQSNDGSAKKKNTTRSEDKLDEMRTLARAEGHTRPQLVALIASLRKQRDKRVSKNARDAVDRALKPLETRLNKYLAIEQAERERQLKKKVII